MFKYSFDLDQVIESMDNSLNAELEKTNSEKLLSTMEYLAEASEKLEAQGLISEANEIIYFMEKIAKKLNKKKSKKSKDPATANLTSEKMVDNLKHKGTPLNVYLADDGKDK